MPQDCIDHMRLAHAVPVSVKAANLGRWVPPWMVSLNIWCKALRSTVYGVSTDALLFSQYGIPLVHQYHVFSRYGTHIYLSGTYMTRLRDFLEQADAESRTLRIRELVHSLASRISLEGPRGTHRREPVEMSRRALSQCPASTSATAPASEAVASPVFNLCQYDRQATSSPIDLALPRFTAKDFLPGRFNWCGLPHRSIRLLHLHRLLNPCALIWILYRQTNRRRARGAFRLLIQ